MTSMLRKGYFDPDGTYHYTCGCGYQNATCAYCYGGDLDKCRAAIKTARGQVYYGLLKTILSHIGKAIVDDAKAITASSGKFTVIDIAWISLQRDLNFKATFEWLEETGVVRAGLYEQVKWNGFKVKDLNEKARKKYEDTHE